MKLLCTIGILATASVATAMAKVDGQTAQKQAPTTEHVDHDGEGSCCSTAPSAATAPRASYLVHANPPAAGAVTGSAKGRIVFEGELEEKDPIAITDQQAKGCTDGPKVDPTDRTLLVSKEKGIRYAVVQVSVKDAELLVPEKPIELDQIACRYEPHVILVPEGATVEYKNSDKITHNVHTFSVKNPAFNKTIAAGSSDEQKLEKSEAINVKCDIHPWMSCYVYVTDTPYAAVTKEDGSFEIPNLPPGEYKVEVWHETLGKSKADLTIAADGSSSPLEVKLSAEEKSGGRRRRR